MKVARERAGVSRSRRPCQVRADRLPPLEEQFDRIVSIGMFEHVGAAHYDEFFAKCRELLKPGGVMLLHTIGSLARPSAPDPFTDKYSSPATSAVAFGDGRGQREGAADRDRRRDASAALRIHAAALAGADTQGETKIVALYDERFFRMWEFYLAGGVVAFESGLMGLYNYQLQYVRDRNRCPLADYARLHDRGGGTLPQARRCTCAKLQSARKRRLPNP